MKQNIGLRIKAIRQANKITQEILAEKCNLSTEAISNIERGIFCPWNNWTWYILEYSHEEKVCFGYVIGQDSEYGYFSIPELESINYRGLGIERDFNFQPCKLSELIKNKY